MTLRLTIAALGLGLLFVAPAFASPDAGTYRDKCLSGERHGAHAGASHTHGARMEARLQALEQALELSPVQADAWTAFTGALQTQAAQMRVKHQARQQDDAAPDRMAAQITRMEARLEGMKAIHAARQQLFDTLSAEQQQTFEQHFSTPRRHQRS